MPLGNPTQSARFSDIVASIRLRLESQLSFASSRIVLLGSSPVPSLMPGEQHIRLRVVGRATDPDSGAGRRGKSTRRTMAVDLVTRCDQDYAGDNTEALTKTTSGHFDFEDRVLDALDLWCPLKISDNTKLTIEPLHEVQTANDPERPRPGDGFIVSTLYLEIHYYAPLNV